MAGLLDFMPSIGRIPLLFGFGVTIDGLKYYDACLRSIY